MAPSYSKLCKEGIRPSTQNKCSFVFPVPCQWNTFSLKAEEKTELLKNFWTELHSVIHGDIGKKKANLKVHECSKNVFQNSDKKTQDNASRVSLVWNELLEWIYFKTNESELLLCFLKTKCGGTYLGTRIIWGDKSCIVFFPLWMWKQYSARSMPVL